MKTICGRIHLGPVVVGQSLCLGCGKVMSPAERVVYSRLQLTIRQIIHDAHEHLLAYLKKKQA